MAVQISPAMTDASDQGSKALEGSPDDMKAALVEVTIRSMRLHRSLVQDKVEARCLLY